MKRKRLPKAPLAEAVFEMRWALVGPQGPEAILFATDPGFAPALEAFTRLVTKAGFPVIRNMNEGSNTVAGPHSVVRRFYAKEGFGFPLLQIGSGIFASNQATDYDWKEFKKQALKGIGFLTTSYPKMRDFPFKPVHMELRYIDAFDETIAETNDLIAFINEATEFKIAIPDFLNDKKHFAGPTSGRNIFTRQIAKRKSTSLYMDIASAQRSTGARIIRIESKITSLADDVPKFRTAAAFAKDVSKWLDSAHDILSPLFERVVQPQIMQKFKADN